MFQQAVTLIRQACNSVVYQQCLNVISALYNEQKKVEDVIKERKDSLNEEEENL